VADSLLQITVAMLEDPTKLAARVLTDLTGDAHSSAGRAKLVREFAGLLTKPSRVLARVDSVTRGAAVGTVQCDEAVGTVGDTIDFYLPGINGRKRITCVATGGTAAAGTISLDGTDNAMALALQAALVYDRRFNELYSTSVTTDTLTITARDPGTWAHATNIVKTVTTAGTFTIVQLAGGDDILDQPTMDIVFGTPNIVADDTISIGNYEYVWKAAASADNEITLSATEATAATNFAAKINGDARWTGILVATRNTATVTLTFVADPRLCQHILVTYAETNAGSVVPAGTVMITGAEAPIIGTTITGNSAIRNWGAGTACWDPRPR